MFSLEQLLAYIFFSSPLPCEIIWFWNSQGLRKAIEAGCWVRNHSVGIGVVPKIERHVKEAMVKGSVTRADFSPLYLLLD